MKEKKSKEEIKQSAGLFYYESIGMILLIISIVIVAKLGKIGYLLSIFFKVLFGDWYLLFVLLVFVFGLYLILMHKGFNFKNQRFIGYIFVIFSILMLSHFSIHKYIIQEEGNYLSNTWKLYKNYIGNQDIAYLGGGLIGGILFYIVYSLLSSFGVVLLSIIFLLFGITMIINKPIVEIGTKLFSFMRKAGSYHQSFKNFFKYEIGTKEKEIPNIYFIKKKITLKNLDEYKNIDYIYNQNKYNEETRSLIISVLNNLNLKYRIVHMFKSYSSSLITFIIYDEFDCNLIGSKLTNLIEENLYISKIGNTLNIEINNKNQVILSLREVLSKQPMLYNNYLIPIGMNVKNQLEEIDFSKEANILIIGDFNVGIKSFVSSLVLTSIIKVTIDNIEFHLFDDYGDFNDYHYLFKSTNNGEIKEYLTKIILEIDERVNLMNLKKVHQIDEYNLIEDEENKEALKRKIYVIQLDDYNNSYDYRYIDDKIMYIIQVGKDVGIYTFFISRNIKKVSIILFSLFKNKVIFNTESIESSLIETKHVKVLSKSGDTLFYRENIIKRMQTPKFTIEELNKIKQEIK